MSEPRHVSEILREAKLFPEPEDLAQKPASRPQECAYCHQTFTANSHWFGSKWHFANVCDSCSKHGRWVKVLDDPTFWEDVEKAKDRIFVCGGCDNEQRVRPTFEAGLWHYEMKCYRCGAKSLGLYRLKSFCEICRKPIFLDSTSLMKRCRACTKEIEAGRDRFANDTFRGIVE